MPLTKIAKEGSPQEFRFNTLSFSQLALIASVGAGVANTTVQSSYVLPQHTKIAKVAISTTASADLLSKFNIVVGTGAYVQGSVGPVDTSWEFGLPTVFAAVGNAVFAADVTLGAAPVGASLLAPSNAPGGFTTASGGSAIFVPTVYDTVYPAGSNLTLRLVTTASTGSISNLNVVMLLEPLDPIPPRNGPTSAYPTNAQVVPGISF